MSSKRILESRNDGDTVELSLYLRSLTLRPSILPMRSQCTKLFGTAFLKDGGKVFGDMDKPRQCINILASIVSVQQ